LHKPDEKVYKTFSLDAGQNRQKPAGTPAGFGSLTLLSAIALMLEL
jgi:hypothetical protein